MPFFNNLPVNVELEECERGENEAALTDLFLVDVFRGVHRIMAVRVLQIGLQSHIPVARHSFRKNIVYFTTTALT